MSDMFRLRQLAVLLQAPKTDEVRKNFQHFSTLELNEQISVLYDMVESAKISKRTFKEFLTVLNKEK